MKTDIPTEAKEHHNRNIYHSHLVSEERGARKKKRHVNPHHLVSDLIEHQTRRESQSITFSSFQFGRGGRRFVDWTCGARQFNSLYSSSLDQPPTFATTWLFYIYYNPLFSFLSLSCKSI